MFWTDLLYVENEQKYFVIYIMDVCVCFYTTLSNISGRSFDREISSLSHNFGIIWINGWLTYA